MTVLLVVFVADAVSLCEAELVALPLAVVVCVPVLLPVVVALHEVDVEGVTDSDDETVALLLSLVEPVCVFDLETDDEPVAEVEAVMGAERVIVEVVVIEAVLVPLLVTVLLGLTLPVCVRVPVLVTVGETVAVPEAPAVSRGELDGVAAPLTTAVRVTLPDDVSDGVVVAVIDALLV